MAVKESFLAELRYESGMTKKILERVPFDKKEWKPHEKSMTIGRLATHIAELPHWVNDIVGSDEYDFAGRPYNPRTAMNPEELTAIFQKSLDTAINALENTSDEVLNGSFKLRQGDFVIFELPKKVAIRNMTMNHIVHHRGQLSVYLRLLNIPVPGIYGPSADER